MIVDEIQLLTAVDYNGALETIASINIGSPDLSQSYILKAASGLDPGDILSQYYASITISQDRYLPQERYYDVKPPERSIALKLQLNPQWSEGETFETLRNQLYNMISYSYTSMVLFLFVREGIPAAYFQSYVTHIETDPFSDQQIVTLVFRTVDPFLRGFATTATIDPESLSEAENFTIDNDTSTAPHGFNGEFVFTTDQVKFVFDGVINDSGLPYARFIIDYDFKSNDILYLRSDRADRQVYVKTYASSYADTVYLMDRVRPNSVWPTMFPANANRHMGVAADSGVLVHDLTWLPTYWGI